MKKSLFTMASLLLVLTAAGCSDITNGLTSNVTGTFTLQTFNGSNLPTLFDSNASQERDLISETLTLYSDGTYADDYRMRTLSASGTSELTYHDTGVFGQNNTLLQFRDAVTGNVFTGSLTGNTLTITQFGDTYVFTR